MSSAVRVAAILADVPATDADQFIIGQNPKGQWVALEIHGRAGGLFRSWKDAMDYADHETNHRPDAVILSQEPIELRI